MIFESKWTVASRLRLLSIMIVVSGIFGVIGSIQITKCGKMHELNTLHLKHNYLFSNALRAFRDDESPTTEAIKRELILIRQQPIDCLGMLGLMERTVISAVGTYRAITLCEEDLALADDMLAAVDRFEAGGLSRRELVSTLLAAEAGFNNNSVQFEPLVGRTVGAVSTAVLILVVSKAVFVGFCGWLMAQSVGKDYDKLERTERSLEQTHGELQNFVYRTSHDFKSPLMGIKSMVRFMKDDIESGEKAEALSNVRRIERNIDVLEKVVSSTLQLAKTDLAEERLEEVALDELIEDVQSHLIEFAHERHVSLEVSDELLGISIKTDRQHLSAAIENLVSNGIKYSSEGEDSTVKIEARQKNGELQLVVQDNGIGIPAEYQPQVFQMFKQFHPDRSEGTGLGMYIVKRSIERLQGRVSLESSEKGTIVTLSLPLAQST